MPQVEALPRCESCGLALPDSPGECPSCGEPTAPPERRLVTVLFADLTGYTELCEQLDPEDVFRFVRPTMTALRQVVESYGGVVPQVQGDGFLALFGAPSAHEDDAMRAVRAAAALGDRIHQLNVTRPDVVVPPLHIGVNTGLVLMARSREEGGISVTGAPVNAGARLCAAASAGEVLVGERTVELCRGLAEFEAPMDLQAKGVAGPLRAYRLRAIRDDVIPGRRALTRQARFVGREDALRCLDSSLDGVAQQGQVSGLAVLGEPGVGKTRLANEWALRRPETTFLVGSCSPYGAVLPFAPLLDALGATAEPERTDPGDDPPAVRQLRKAAAEAPGPVALVIDDIQWAGPELLDALGWLVRDPWPLPLLVVVLARSDAAVPEVIPTVSLQGLAPEHLRSLLDDIVGAPVPEPAAQRLVARSGGSPLFLEESAALLLDSGRIVVTDGSVVVDDAGIASVPNSMRMFITARLDALPEDELGLLRDAAVAGEATWDGLVEAMGSSRQSLLRCVERGLLRVVPSSEIPGEDRYEFKHALIREVAFEALPRRERAVRHRRAADWLVSVHGSPAAPQSLGLLAYHYHQAWLLARTGASSEGPCDLAVLAVNHLHDWGRELERHQARGAEAAYAQALDVIESAPGCIDDATQARLHVDRARTLNELARFIESLDEQRHARRIAEQHGIGQIVAEVLSAQAMSLSDLGRMEEARDAAEQARSRFREIGDRRADARVLHEIAFSYRFEDVHVMLDLLRRAHAAYADVEDIPGQAAAARDIAYVQTMEGGADFARWRDVAASAISETDLRGVTARRRTEAFLAQHQGDWATALGAATETTAMAVSAGSRWAEVDATLTRQAALFRLGMLREAEGAQEDALALAERVGGRRTRALALVTGARVALRRRQPLRAERDLEQARRLLAELGAVCEGLDVDISEAELRLDRGFTADVAARISPAIEWFEERGWGFYVVPARVLLGRSALLADPLSASAPLAAAIDAARRHEQLRFGALAAASLVEAQLLAGLPANGLIAGGDGDLIETRGTMAECLGLRAWRAGNFSEAARHFGDAAALWDTLGATVWLARAMLWHGEATRQAGGTFDDAPAHSLLADLHAPEGLDQQLRGALPRSESAP